MKKTGINKVKKNSRITPLYILATSALFLGILWAALPHAFHSTILGPEELENHSIHVLQGGILAIVGAVFLVWNERKQNKKNHAYLKI